MRLPLVLILLAFPIAELWILIDLFQRYGGWVALYLVVVAMLGFRLIQDEKLLFSGRMMQSLAQGGNPIKAMLGGARNIIAGILLIIPGVITDVMAAILLLIPVNHRQQSNPMYPMDEAANDDVIEGEFHRED